MSKCIVEVCTIDEIKKHSNADKLEIAIIKGWQCVTQKGAHTAGEKIVYFPPDTVIPDEWAAKFGVTQYLSKGRIRSIKLRGEPSFGLIVKPADPSWPIGKDVADFYGAMKYEPPPINQPSPYPKRQPKSWLGRFIKKWTWMLFNVEPDIVQEHPKFPKYTEIENLRHYNRILQDGEQVVVTEKIHGCLMSDTPVMLANGEYIPISKIVPGMFVTAYDEMSKTLVPAEVEHVVVQSAAGNWITLNFSGNNHITCTEDHKILTNNRGWVPAKDITESDDVASCY